MQVFEAHYSMQLHENWWTIRARFNCEFITGKREIVDGRMLWDRFVYRANVILIRPTASSEFTQKYSAVIHSTY